MEETGALAIDDKKYARVLAKVLPRVIASAGEHERSLAEVEKLMDKGERRSKEEDAALDLMVRRIEDYEEAHHPLPDPSPYEMLAYLMEKRISSSNSRYRHWGASTAHVTDRQSAGSGA